MDGEIKLRHMDQDLTPTCSEVTSGSAPASEDNGNDKEAFFFCTALCLL